MNRDSFLKAICTATGVSLLLPKKASSTFIPGGVLLPKYTTGQKFLLFGDSITETYSANFNNIPNWPTYITPLGAIISNYARWAAQYKDKANPNNSRELVYNQINDAIAANETPDVIIFSLGTNDQENNLGSYATAMGKTTLAELDRTNLYEALRWAYWKCRTQWPGKKMFTCLPLQRGDVNIVGMTSLRAALVTMANRYNIIIIDQTYESGIIADLEVPYGAGLYLDTDGVHTTTAGKQLQAKYIMSRILADSMY